MRATTLARRSSMRVNGADLYHELRGAGPTVLFIPGASGDAGVFAQVADLLADSFTVVTYDRRGNSRSSRPAGWTSTSIEEQADDAAWLLRALQLAPAAVFGTSLGAPIALEMMLRHPDVVRRAILHEPALFAVLAQPQEVNGLLQTTIQRGIEAGGPRGGLEALLRLAWGDATFDRMDPSLRERLLGNAEVALNVEAPCFGYRPDEAKLARVKVPVQVVTASQSPSGGLPFPFFAEMASWLATRVGTRPTTLPGRHGIYLDAPHELADAMRAWLAED